MRGESRESEPPRQGPGNTRLELAETTTPAVRCPGLPTPTRCKAALADTSQGSSQPRGGQVSSAAPRPSASPRSGSCAGAKGAQAGARDTAGAGPGATSLGRSLLLPQRPGCSPRRRPRDAAPVRGRRQVT